MRCPFCNHNEDKVIDSRETSEATAVRRRRECLSCGKRYTTYEYVEKNNLMVIKRDGRRETFNPRKILSGLLRACEKRPVSVERLERVVSEIETEIHKRFDQEVDSTHIGELVMDRLSKIDDIAYVRFASVYRQFKDINQFMYELKDVLVKKVK